MPDSKISALTAASSLLSTDEFVIASGGASKKVTMATLGGTVVKVGTLAARPAASLADRLYLATDTYGGTLYRDTGSAWVTVSNGRVATYMRTSFYYGPFASTAATTSILSRSFFYAAPFFVSQDVTIDRIACKTSAGGAGATLRMGIYTDVNGVPTDLVLDSGSVDNTTPAIKEVTVSQALSAGIYWIGAVTQGSVDSTLYVHSSPLGAVSPLVPLSSNDVYAALVNGYYFGGAITAALPATFTTPGTGQVTNVPPKVIVRIA
ncbi:MAG: hypothetical protein H0U18_09940 [Pyrinomonadaceae bacterium]|nr:hypothetical protein [Pyrinomonadaceae bacterium]